MASDLVLGIDLGTTALKAAVFDGRGRRLRAFAAPLATRRGPVGTAEQDAAEWLARLGEALEDARDLLPAIGAVGVTSQVNTHVFVDAAGRALAPAILWSDTRAAGEAAVLDARIAPEERLDWWGAPMGVDASHALARMAWMQRHRPEAWARTAAVLLPKDFILQHLTGTRASDPLSNIGLAGADLGYPPGLLALLPGAAGRLPPLRDPAAVAGTTRLAPGLTEVPVAVGVMDAWAGFLGAGLARDGDAAWLSGTSEVVAAASEVATGEPGILVFPRWAGLRVHAGPTQSGGASLDWLARALDATPDALCAEVEAAGPDLRAPLFLPHLAGERAPLWDSSARGAFLGLEAGMGRAAMARGVMEGVALSARLLLEAMDRSTGRRAEVLLCGGGGFRSEAWAQLRADVTGRVLRRAAVTDAGTLGAAALASVAAGLAPDLPAALGGLVTHDRVFDPDPARAARYDDLFALYRPAYEALRPISRALAARQASGVPSPPG